MPRPRPGCQLAGSDHARAGREPLVHTAGRRPDRAHDHPERRGNGVQRSERGQRARGDQARAGRRDLVHPPRGWTRSVGIPACPGKRLPRAGSTMFPAPGCGRPGGRRHHRGPRRGALVHRGRRQPHRPHHDGRGDQPPRHSGFGPQRAVGHQPPVRNGRPLVRRGARRSDRRDPPRAGKSTRTPVQVRRPVRAGRVGEDGAIRFHRQPNPAAGADRQDHDRGRDHGSLPGPDRRTAGSHRTSRPAPTGALVVHRVRRQPDRPDRDRRGLHRAVAPAENFGAGLRHAGQEEGLQDPEGPRPDGSRKAKRKLRRAKREHRASRQGPGRVDEAEGGAPHDEDRSRHGEAEEAQPDDSRDRRDRACASGRRSSRWRRE